MKGDRFLLGILVGVGAIGLASERSLAQSFIVPDGTLGNERSQVNIWAGGEEITGGAIRGMNLFHSFREFNVGAGRVTYFIAPNSGIENILARVTGSNRSDILGRLGTGQRVNGNFEISNATLFLINPNGIVFGKDASLDIGRSFVATTANAIGFGDTGLFSASNPVSSNLLTIDPSIFIFSNQQPRAIVNRAVSGLQVPQGQGFLLVGGDVQMEGGSLRAPGGRVELGGVSAPGRIGLEKTAGELRLNFLEDVVRSDVSLMQSSFNQSIINVASDGGGSISISARNFIILGDNRLDAGISSGFGTVNSQAGDIIVNATESIQIEGTGGIFNTVQAGAMGNAGNIILNAGSLSIKDGAQVSSRTLGQGDAGNVTLAVRDIAVFDGVGSSGFSSVVGSQVNSNAKGKAGNLTVNVGSLTVTNGAQLNTSTFGQGDGGNITLTVRDTATFDGVGRNGFSSAAESRVGFGAIGKGGTLTVNAGSLTVTNGAQLDSSNLGQGDGGNITLTVRDTATFDGISSTGIPSSAGGNVGSKAEGKGTTLTVNAGSLTVTNGAVLTSSTFGKGDGGNITLRIRDTATFDGVGGNGFRSGAESLVNIGAVGTGGTLTVTAGSLNVTNGAVLTSTTFGTGDAGNITLTVRDTATFNGVGINGFPAFAGSRVAPNAVGKGGTLTVTAGSLNVTNGAVLNSSTFGTGDAGNITLTVRDTATFDGVGSNGFSSTAESKVGFKAVGKGGILTVNAGALNVTNGAVLTSSTFGQGDAGNIILTVRDTAIFDGVGSNGFSSTAESIAGLNAGGKGGTLTVNAGSLTVTDGAQLNSSTLGPKDAGGIVIRVRDTLQVKNGLILTSSLFSAGGSIDINAKTIRLSGSGDIISSVFSGAGGGGDITITARSIVALNDSDILAFARDGKGGNVTLNTRAFFGQNYRPAPFGTDPLTLEGNDRVDINATGSISGIITLPDVSFITNSLNQLSKDAIDTTKLLASTCIVRQEKPTGTFYITGTGGIPNRPNDPAISDYPTNTIQPTAEVADKPWKLGDPIVEPQGFYQLANGRFIMSRECNQ